MSEFDVRREFLKDGKATANMQKYVLQEDR